MRKTRVTDVTENSATITMGDDYSDLEGLAVSLNGLVKKYSIKKAKLKDIALQVEYNENVDDTSNKVGKDCTAPVHEDLKAAFKSMNVLLREITEQPDESEVECTGFTIGRDEDGAVLIGYRDLDSGAVLNLTSPYTKYEDNGQLAHSIARAKQEVLLYLFEKKHAPDQQLSLFSNGNEQSGDEF